MIDSISASIHKFDCTRVEKMVGWREKFMKQKLSSKKINLSLPAILVLALILVANYWLNQEPEKEPYQVHDYEEEIVESPYTGMVEQVSVPKSGDAVRLLTMNACNYFVQDDVRRSNFKVKYKSLESREALVKVIKQSGAEMIGLSEMGGEKAVEDLQTRLKREGLQFPHQVMVMRQGEDRGLAFLSKHPIVCNNSVKDVPVKGGKKKSRMLRGILDVTVQVADGRKFRCIGLHLKSRLDRATGTDADVVRNREAVAVRKYLNKVMQSQEGMPLLVYGDFNDGPADKSVQKILGPSKTDMRLNRIKAKDSRDCEWTLYFDDFATYYTFDLILVNKVLKSRLGRKAKNGVMDCPEMGIASDHRAVWVDLH